MDKSKLLKLLSGLVLIVSVLLVAVFIYRSRMSRSTSAEELAEQLKSMESRYLKHEGFQIFVTTYNVNKKSPSEADKLSEDWLTIDSNSSDLYVIGLQEADLTREEESQGLSESSREEAWLNGIVSSLNAKGKYAKVSSVRLGGTMLAVFVKKDLQDHVYAVASTKYPAGVLGKWGHKAVLIRFELHHTSLCFVSSHLMPFDEETEMRNQEFHEIRDRATFSFERGLTYVADHDLVYWLGDLNYRLDGLGPDEIKQRIADNETESLVAHDQLKRQQKLNKTFTGYNEAPITFVPTYKYDPGTDRWDSSAKNRAPAWCDRILWNGQAATDCVAYRSHPKLLPSDHKPVSALFNTQIKLINTKEYKKAYKEAVDRLGIKRSDIRPEVTVDKKQIDFGKFSFRDQAKGTLTIRNTGLVDVYFDLRMRSGLVSPSWLRIKPSQGALMVGQERRVDLEIEVDQLAAADFAKRSGKLSDQILVLGFKEIHENLKKPSYSVTGIRREVRITLTGNYTPSSFGSSIECLTRLNKSVSDTAAELSELLLNEHPNDTDKETPKELRFIIDKLLKNGPGEKLLFAKPGLRCEFRTIRKAVDAYDLSQLLVSTHSLAEAVLYFLDSLAEPVVPYAFYAKAIEKAVDLDSSKQVIEEIPKTHRKVFNSMIAFMKDILNHSDENRLSAKRLAAMFGDVMLKPFKGHRHDDKNRALFVYNFLVDDQQ